MKKYFVISVLLMIVLLLPVIYQISGLFVFVMPIASVLVFMRYLPFWGDLLLMAVFAGFFIRHMSEIESQKSAKIVAGVCFCLLCVVNLFGFYALPDYIDGVMSI